MFSSISLPNTEAAGIRLIKLSELNINLDDAIWEPNRHRDHSSLLAVSNLLPMIKKAMYAWYGQKQKTTKPGRAFTWVGGKKSGFYKTDKQHGWRTMAEVTATPTLLLNGYRLPDLYQTPDLTYTLEQSI